MLSYKTIVVKIGSNVLTRSDGLPDMDRMSELAQQIHRLEETGIKTVLVSSGAVAFGRSLNLNVDTKNSLAARQVWAATGQVKLVQAWQEQWEPLGMMCAQVMVTREDFRSRRHYLNMRQCIHHLLGHGVIPVVNENDVVAVTELMFTDNDELAGLIAAMTEADALIILTNVDGIYDRPPNDDGARLIQEIEPSEFKPGEFIGSEKSSFGRGGMITKASMARKTAGLGISVHIANGLRDNILVDIINENVDHTVFAAKDFKRNRKKWIAHSGTFSNGKVVINQGAIQALNSDKATSLLPVGIVDVISEFRKGDIIKIVSEEGNIIGWGKAEYSSEKTRKRLGLQKQKVLVHYDYLFIEEGGSILE
ncbi:glutamate 5-kinase [Membranihabitans maritimus]|uniref:glutamate 5-kinase n=1 Tax=Membranihabitans maritimus TaxID=2904244 RepID=UPI001F0239B9|nr:glutamate 5-kinase [Membranihabitans maritimus]